MNLLRGGLATQADFATCSLAGSGLVRHSRIAKRYRPEGYDRDFDADTLWVDAIHVPPRVVLVCPRLNNLRGVLGAAQFTADGRPVIPRFREYKRHAIIEFDAPVAPARLSIRIGEWSAETPVHAMDRETFRDRDVLVTVSRDNDLRWIHDFARFHVRHQGIDGMLFIDNGSAAYGPLEIQATLRRAGVAQPVVLSTTLKYGPRGRKLYANSELFLQTCLLNIARLRSLSSARGVLNCDVDELVHSKGGTVFDLARRSRFGFVRFAGVWRFPSPGFQGRACHAAHVFGDPACEPCPPKWCLVPGGPFGRLQWRAHKLEPLPLSRLFVTQEAGFWHCRAVTTSWQGAGRLSSPPNTVPDPRMQAALERAGIG